MSKQEPDEDFSIQALELQDSGRKLLRTLEECSDVKKIDGIVKLKKRIQSELDFLASLLAQGKAAIKKNHVCCSNLIHYGAIVDKMLEIGVANVDGVLRSMALAPGPRGKGDKQPTRRVDVDLITNNKTRWIKVKAMKASSVHSVLVGSSRHGHKSVMEIAKDLIACAENNLINYTPPIIVFTFSQGITEQVKMRLMELGVRVEGEIVEPDDEMDYDSEDEDSDSSSDADQPAQPVRLAPTKLPEPEAVDFSEPTVANLDVTSLICLVSDVTNGGCKYDFEDPVLQEQALAERSNPSLPPLIKFLEGKRLITAQTAYNHFRKIVDIVGGPTELARVDEWMKKIEIVPDQPSEASGRLSGPKIRDQHRIVFGTGDSYRAVTTTCNISLVRTAEQQGVRFCVHIHPARALTEQKIPKSSAAVEKPP